MLRKLTVPILRSETQNLDCQLLTADLTLSAESHESCYRLLSPEERDRAMRFIQPIHQRHFIAARGLLRTASRESGLLVHGGGLCLCSRDFNRQGILAH